MRAVVTKLIQIAILMCAARAFLVEPIAVQTSSMAPHVLGLHGAAPCPICGEEILWGTDLTSLDVASVTCPRCGAAQTEFADRLLVGGDRLLVDRSAFLLRGPRRWDLAALSDPESPNRWLVKRIVGLPGETIAIHGGDLYAGNQRIEKSLHEFRALTIPVNDMIDESEDPRLLPWRGETDAAHWEAHRTRSGGSFLHVPTLSAMEFDWLAYRPILKGNRAELNRLSDALPYNQDRLRQPFAVTDVLLTFQARFQGDGRLAIRFPTRKDVVLALDPRRGRAEILVGGASRYTSTFDDPGSDGPIPITAAYCDGRVLARLGEQEFQFRVEPRTWDEPPEAEGRPASLAIGASGVRVEISGLRLKRDVYYAGPADRPETGAVAYSLAQDEYLMLGDNPSRSYDSRYWTPPGVRRNSLLGRPFLLHGANRAWRVGPWTIQVPDFRRIRYIPPAAGE